MYIGVGVELNSMCQESGCADEYVRFDTRIVSKSHALPRQLVMIGVLAQKHLERALWLGCVDTFFYL